MTVRRRTVLVVDDNADLRAVTRELLESLGYRVFTAASGTRAFEMFSRRTEEIDVLITDLALPDLPGLELAERLREDRPDLGVLLVSIHSSAGALHPRLEQQRMAFLPKPFFAADLEDRVNRAIEMAAKRDLGGPAPARPAAVAPARLRTLAPASGRGSRNTASRRAVAAALAVLAALSIWTLMRSAAPPLPDTVPDSVMRGTEVEPLFPLGELDSMPAELRWEPASGADRYRVTLYSVAGTPLWEGDSPVPRLDLPPAALETLHPMVVYHWRVEALDSRDLRVAESERASFRVVSPLKP